MIHSMSGGVLFDGELLTFVKVDGEAAGWYLSPVPVKVGEKVLVPFGNGSAEGNVIRLERCTAQTSPVPAKRAKTILRVLSLDERGEA